ncbi:hypothetical protein RF11_14364 [Thelohanellus kitauei]|uniref:Uncharacterized protein n=1 Tax=Thelohanellus kitauei TaxID=669202 RepID=A0A0C2NIV3_THEKT|nr:hypothetical protein RF11_14364 [Thelohanellus kitauei]
MEKSDEKKCLKLTTLLIVEIFINTMGVLLTLIWAFTPSRFVIVVDEDETLTVGIFSARLGSEHIFIFMNEELDNLSILSNIERIVVILIFMLFLFKYVFYLLLYFNETRRRMIFCLATHVISISLNSDEGPLAILSCGFHPIYLLILQITSDIMLFVYCAQA